MNGPVTSANKLKWDPSITNPLYMEMVDLLRCHQCKKLNYSVHNLSKCAHVVCGDCKNGMSARKCPVCKLPAVEIKRDSDYESLIKDVRLLNQQYLKISFAADKNTNKVPSSDKKITSPPRPVVKAVISPVKKVDNAAKGLELSQELSQLTDASRSIFTQDLSIDEDKLDDASDTEAIDSANKRKGRGKAQEKIIPMKKQKLASDSTEKQINAIGDDKNKRRDKDKDQVKEREAEKEAERLKEKEKEKERVKEKEKEKEKEKLREKEKEKLKEKELQKKLEKEKKEAEKLEKEKAKELEKERKEKEKELAKERAKERAREKAKERALEKAKAKLKEMEEKEKAEEEKNKNKNEDDADADADAEDNEKAKSKSRKKVLAKEKVKEVESDAQTDNSKSSKVESVTKKRGKIAEDEAPESKDKVSVRGRSKKKVVEEKEKEDKNKESESDDKRSTRSSPSKNLSSKNKDASPRRTGRTLKTRDPPTTEDGKKSSEDQIDTSNEEIIESKNKNQDVRKSVTFSPTKETESTVSPRKSPRSNKGNMMYSRRPDELPVMTTYGQLGPKARSETKSKETDPETETPKSTSSSKAASSRGRAKPKAKEPETSVDDEDIFVKPKPTSKRAARLDSTDPSPLKRQRKAKETSDESDSPSPARSTSSRSNASKNTKSNSRILIASTLLTPDQKKILEKFKSSLGIRITPDFPSNVSHLVTKSDSQKRAVRSLKYMKALLTHKWIVSFDWITESLKAGELLPEEPYELRGTTKQPENSLGAPKFSRTSKKKLFAGINFYFDGKFKSPDLPNLEELRDIVSTGGGTIFDNNLRLNSALRKNERVIIVKDKVKGDDESTGSGKHIETAVLLAVVTAYQTDELFN